MFKAGTSTYFILNTPINKYFSLHLNRLLIVLNKFLVKIKANKFYISAINRFKVHVIFWRQNEKNYMDIVHAVFLIVNDFIFGGENSQN